MEPRLAFPSSFLSAWTERLEFRQAEQANDFPNYYVQDLSSLVTTSRPRSLFLGTGHFIFQRALLPAILRARHSIDFVTCYWAASPTLDDFRDALIQLAENRRRSGFSSPLFVTIGFSSSGLFQKLLHTSSRSGHVYPPKRWPSLGLPDEAVLREGGIELRVKSLFFRPFSVMHPKYLVVDDAKAWVPSCNVSWERWFEGCLAVEGDVVQAILRFHRHVWGSVARTPSQTTDTEGIVESSTHTEHANPASPSQTYDFPDHGAFPTLFLPSSHHRNPGFSIFPLLSQKQPPVTPLNAALMALFENASRQILIISPNFTSWPVLEALLNAIRRGVDVRIRTSKNMMLIEQLVTAGTTTASCLRRFISCYEKSIKSKSEADPEAQLRQPGKLTIQYFRPAATAPEDESEPVLSHLKLTLVDDEFLVLGSGNQDRASWWTSQEIGVLLHLDGFAGAKLLDQMWSYRSEQFYGSG